MRFRSKIGLVTGANGSIGSAIANMLVDEGGCVHAISRNEPSFGSAIWHRADFTDDTATENAAEALAAQIEHLDVLVHAAGQYATGTVADAPIEQFDELWRVNVRAPMVLTRALLPALKAARGTVVFLNSSVWLRASGALANYSASKYALKAVADALRDEVNEAGVRVQSLFPGRTAGHLQERLSRDTETLYDPERMVQPIEIAEMVLHSLTASRSAEVTDVHFRPMRKPGG